MSLIRWSPMFEPFQDMDEMFNRLPALMGSQQMKAFVPAINMYETDKAVMIEIPLAGVRPEDVEVSVQKEVLVLKGQSKKEHEVDEKNFYRKEVRSGSFYREITLPTSVLEDKVSAEFEDGMLRITCPKSGPTEAKRVNVKVIKKDGKK
ncbi:MAG: Hsp20/alpha crystallin family protein [Candidatus Magasanikbacteria bacterium]|nr:Hsp20/alpha crystallin family protein [Candidatus Magasanikbacteria bacterium]